MVAIGLDDASELLPGAHFGSTGAFADGMGICDGNFLGEADFTMGLIKLNGDRMINFGISTLAQVHC